MAMRKLDEIIKAASELSAADKVELAKYLIASSTKREYPDNVVDISRFYGMAKFEEDAMELQRRWRAEWD